MIINIFFRAKQELDAVTGREKQQFGQLQIGLQFPQADCLSIIGNV